MAEVKSMGPYMTEGERRFARSLKRRLPRDAVVLTNVYLPKQGAILEVDAIVIAPMGVWAVEIKDWTGTVEFRRGCCIHRDRQVSDPRASIDMKARRLRGILADARMDHPINSLVVIGSKNVSLTGRLDESVHVRPLDEAVDALSKGQPRTWTGPTLEAQQIRRIAQCLDERRSLEHRPQVGQYLRGEAIKSGGPYQEYWGVDANEPDRMVRLKRSPLDPLADQKERAELMTLAQRHAAALNKLQSLHNRALPILYATFEDEDDDGAMWTAYEAVDGLTLMEALIPLKEKLLVLSQVAETLERCHTKNVLHRALSPNCLVLPPGERIARILHFDFARVQGKATVAVGKGKVELQKNPHVAPEVRRDPTAATPASDVWSLGRTAGESLVGRGFSELESADLERAVRKLRPPEVPALLAKMMDRNPKLRPTMTHVADLLKKAAR